MSQRSNICEHILEEKCVWKVNWKEFASACASLHRHLGKGPFSVASILFSDLFISNVNYRREANRVVMSWRRSRERRKESGTGQIGHRRPSLGQNGKRQSRSQRQQIGNSNWLCIANQDEPCHWSTNAAKSNDSKRKRNCLQDGQFCHQAFTDANCTSHSETVHLAGRRRPEKGREKERNPYKQSPFLFVAKLNFTNDGKRPLDAV